MSDTFEHNTGDHEDPLPTATWMIGFISAVLLIVVFFGLVSLFYGATKETAAEQLSATEVHARGAQGVTTAEEVAYREHRTSIEKLRRVEKGILDAPPRWISVRAGNTEVERLLVVPIDDAMDLLVQESNR